MIPRTLRFGLMLGAAGVAGALVDQGITRISHAQETARASVQLSATRDSAPDLAARFIAHPEHLRPAQRPPRGVVLRNPYAGNASAIATGAKLFVAYNCMDCHGADGSGAMGPSLQDSRWHFGGTAGDIYQSIYEGRPDGMPAWGGRIADDQIWRLVAYVQTLSKGHDVATENFTGKTIARSGH
jgi:cytochrome c oxidase cbb3-type subunit 3